MVGSVGFEPTHPKGTDLQSAVTLQLYGLPILKYMAPSLGTAPSSHSLTDWPHAMCVTRNIMISMI